MKRGIIFVLLFVLLIGTASAYTVSKTNLQSGLDSVSISGASNAYSYEVNFTLDGSLTEVPAFDNFLKGGDNSVTTSNGDTLRGSNLFVYSSRLDNTKTGVTGSGRLFNVSYSGTLTLTGAVVVNTAGESDHESYLTTTTTSSSSGGGGSSSSNATFDTSSIKIRIVPDIFTITSIYGIESIDEITIINDGDKTASLEISFEGGAADFITADNSINVGAHSEKKLKLKINGARGGIITGRMIFNVNGQKVAELPIVLNVRSENFLFDVSVSVSKAFKRLLAGQTLKAQINLLEVEKQEEKVDVTATYSIQDFLGNTHIEESDTFFVLGGKDYVKEIYTKGLEPGKYIFGLEVVYPGAFATSSAQFEILPKKIISGNITIIIVIASVLFAVLIAVMFWALRRRRVIYRKMRYK